MTSTLRRRTSAQTASLADRRGATLLTRANGERYLVVTSIVDDPTYLQIPWVTALIFKQEPGTANWDPTPCDARF